MPTPNIDSHLWLLRGPGLVRHVVRCYEDSNAVVARAALQRLYDGPILNPLRSAVGVTK